ncbi:MAG: ATP-binding protein [Candidatus Competibacteraceae bacterium]|nr:ATP-binding protein [Candidatus Competibacteraceae bacterium]
MTETHHPNAERILIFTHGEGNAQWAQRMLGRMELTGEICPDMEALCQGIEQGAGAVLASAEALPPEVLAQLRTVLEGQPFWSLLPVVVLVGERDTPWSMDWTPELFQSLRGVIMLTRPVHLLILRNVLHNALESRRRQYQVRDLVARLEVGVRQRDEFLAMLGHELRNPLAPIRNLVDVFRMSDDLPLHLEEGLELMDLQVGHLNRLVDDLLDVARVTQGRIALHKTRLDLGEVVRQAVGQVEWLIESRRHRLTVDLPSRPLLIEADATRLVQVVTNLLDNAAKYTDPGGRIRLLARREDGQAVLRVQDTGAGIPVDLLPNIFDLFAQGARAPDRAPGGLGLGLSLVRRLVEMHGGQVQARSSGPGRGSELEVRLPILKTPPMAESSVPEEEPRPQRPILVVDDDPAVAKALSLLLRSLGHSVQTAFGGHEALELARRQTPQIVLLDLGMPEMDGFEVARRLRQAHGPALKLVALTGYGREQDQERVREAGFDHHLLKPARMEDIQALLSGEDTPKGKV